MPHRVRDTSTFVASGVPGAMQHAALGGVMLRRTGTVRETALVTVPALRSGMKNAAPRPGHEHLRSLRCPGRDAARRAWWRDASHNRDRTTDCLGNGPGSAERH